MYLRELIDMLPPATSGLRSAICHPTRNEACPVCGAAAVGTEYTLYNMRNHTRALQDKYFLQYIGIEQNTSSM